MQSVPGVGQVPRARGQRQLPPRSVAPSQSSGPGPQHVAQVQQSQGRMGPGGLQGGPRFKFQPGVRNQHPAHPGSMGMPPHEQQTIQIPVSDALALSL